MPALGTLASPPEPVAVAPPLPLPLPLPPEVLRPRELAESKQRRPLPALLLPLPYASLAPQLLALLKPCGGTGGTGKK